MSLSFLQMITCESVFTACGRETSSCSKRSRFGVMSLQLARFNDMFQEIRVEYVFSCYQSSTKNVFSSYLTISTVENGQMSDLVKEESYFP